MFRIGTVYTKKFTVKITPPHLDLIENKQYLSPEIKKMVTPFCKPYYDYSRVWFYCSVIKVADYNYYVDLHADQDFPSVSFRFPPKVIAVPTDEESIYETEYRYWKHNKDFQQSMLYLHRSSIEKIINRCREISQ